MISDRDSAKQPTAAWENTEKQVTDEQDLISNVSDSERAARFGQTAATVLFTGLTGTGKTTIARAVERSLFDGGRAVAVLDGELMRRGVNMDLGYTVEERSENLRRSAHVAKLFNDSGLICLAAFVAPSQSVRERVADVVGKERFVTIYCIADEATRLSRDAKKQAGTKPISTKDQSVYESPEKADLVLDTSQVSLSECVDAVVELLKSKSIIR